MKAALILSLGTLALAAPAPEAGSQKVAFDRKRHQIQTRSDGLLDLDWFFGQVRTTTRKYNKNIVLSDVIESAGLKKRASSDPLTDNVEDGEDEDYYGAGTIGSAAQKFTFDFDTGSSDTFVPGPKCGTSQGCPGSTKYNQNGKDEGNTTTVTYGSGMITGENYYDNVTIAGLTATHQNIISLTSASGFDTLGSDGLMGMGFQSIANSLQPPYFFTLINEKKVSPTEFSFYLGRAQSNTQAKSELTLSGRDSSRYTGAFTAVPVTQQGYWQVAIDGASVGSSSSSTPLSSTAGQAAIDTGTTLIIAPTAAASAIFSKIPGSFPLFEPPYTFYTYPCSATPQVNLIFAGKGFSINALDLNFGQVSDGFFGFGGAMCMAAIAGADLVAGEELWIVGDSFLKNWYSTYTVSGSKATVSFAKAV